MKLIELIRLKSIIFCILIAYTIQIMHTEAEPGGLIGILRKNKKEELLLLVLGLDYSGKTTILKLLTKEVTITPFSISATILQL